MSLEPTDEQKRIVLGALAVAIGRLGVWAKSSYSPESVADSLPMLVEVAWPLIRDMVLAEAAKVCDAREAAIAKAPPHALGRAHNETAATEAMMCGLSIRAMKGPP